ncbi:hypothetical protein PV392_20000 [Streptomyces sp. ME03-5709C]|nr:hypothetical protein [Streptomyces sp. ME03-5709C]
MSDNRGHDWLDEAAAERLLRGVHGDRADRTRPDERAAVLAGLLAAAAAPAPLDPEREEAAVAAFRAARDGDACTRGFTGGRLGGTDRAPGAGTGPAFRGGRGRAVRDRGRLRAATLIAAAAAAMAGAGVAAAGVLPALLGHGVPDPAPVRPRVGVTAASDSASPPHPTGPSASSRSGPGSGPGDVAGGGDGAVVPGRTAGAPSSTPAQDHTALCRAYAAADRHHKGVDEQVYKPLREAAGGGEGKVRRYCAGLLGVNSGNGGNGGNSGNSGNGGNGGNGGKSGGSAKSGTGKSGDSGNSGNAGNGGESARSGTGKNGGSGNSGNAGKGGTVGTADASGDEDSQDGQDGQDGRKKPSLGIPRPAGPGRHGAAGE